MKKLKKYLIILSGILLFSCNKNKPSGSSNNENISLFDIKTFEWKKKKDFKIKDIINDIEYIQLENNETSMFVSIDKLIINDDRIYLLDIGGSPKLLVFDISGKFLHKIGRQGIGPGEYASSAPNFCIDKQSNEVLLFDRAKKTILFYDSNGDYLKSKKTNFSFNDFVKINNDKYFLSLNIFQKSNNYNKVAITSDLKNMETSYFKFDKNYKNDKLNMRSFQPHKNMIAYMAPVSDTLFIFDNNGSLEGGYYFDFKKHKLPQDLINSYEEVIIKRKKGTYYTYIHETPLIIKNYIIASLFMNNQKCIAVFNTNNLKSTYEILNPNTFDMKNINFPLCTIGDSILVSYIDQNIYDGIEDKLLLSADTETHLKTGGTILCLNTIK